MCWINNSFYNIQHCNTNIFLFSQSFLVINIPLNVIKPVSRVILLIEDIEITNPFPSNSLPDISQGPVPMLSSGKTLMEFVV
jgi:hypothetical protein